MIRPRRRHVMAIASAVAGVTLPHALARATAVDFSTFASNQGVQANGFAVPTWTTVGTYNNIAVDAGRVAQVTPDSDTTYFVGPSALTTLNKVITGDVYFGNDDDVVGLAVGMPQDPFTNTSADYLLLSWKGTTQTVDFHDVPGSSNFHNTTVGGSNPAGLSLSRVHGVPTADEFWQRANLTMYDPGTNPAPNPATDPPLGFDTGGLTELGRGAASGAKTYDRSGKRVPFEITYTPSNITVKVGGTQEFSLAAPAGQSFPEGTLG